MPGLLDYLRPQPQNPFGPFNSRVTYYAPGPGDRMEGGFETSQPNPQTGKRVPSTLDDVRLGTSPFVTLAGDPSRYGQTVKMGPLTYTSPIDQKSYTLPDVTGYVHDTGSAFKGRPDKLDVAAGDYRGYSPQAASAAVQADAGRRTVTPLEGDEADRAMRPIGMPEPWRATGEGYDQTAVAQGPPPQQGRKMPNSLMDMFQPQDAAGQPTDLGGALTGRSNSLIGLGLGLLSPSNPLRGESSWSNALQGYMGGAALDTRQATAKASLAHQKTQDAFRAAEAMRNQYNTDRSYKEGQRQFDVGRELKPSIHWTADKTDEKGDVIPGKPYYVDPANQVIREMRPEDAFKVPLPQTGAVPGAPAAAGPDQQSSADETAIPSTATPVQATPAPALPLNRRKAIEAYSTETGKDTAKRAEKEQAGSRVIGLIDRLITKTQHPDDPSKDNPLFAEATGPVHEYASNQPVWNPARLAYEYTPLGPSKKAQGYLGQIRSDAQAINSELQQAYLLGQGSVTENERAQISDILGKVAAARSPEEARGLLNNAKGILSIAMQKGYAAPGATGPNEPPPKEPAASPSAPREPNEKAIKVLRAAPHRAKEFDERYGPGSAARYLNDT